MEPSGTPLVLLGLFLGTIAAELAWWAGRPFIGADRSAPPGRVLIGIVSILGSAALIALLARLDRFAGIAESTWTYALGSCAIAQSWLLFLIFSRLTRGGIRDALLKLALATQVITIGLCVMFAGNLLVNSSPDSIFAIAVVFALITIGVGLMRILAWRRIDAA